MPNLCKKNGKQIKYICIYHKILVPLYSTKMRIYAKKANKMIIKRPLYLKQLINRQHNGMIKIITGMTLATFFKRLSYVLKLKTLQHLAHLS